MSLERITHASAPSGVRGHYVPRVAAIATISASSSTGTEQTRTFRADDAGRVLDYDDMPEPPPDGPVLRCEEGDHEDAGARSGGPIDTDEAVSFPRRHAMIRGAYIFYFDEEDVEPGAGPDGTTLYDAPPLGVVPLDRTSVDFPPGGRRVFKEHAHTDARNGYEMCIKHAGGGGIHDPDEGDVRPEAFLVFSSLGQREAWAAAIRVRAEAYRKDTKLRPGPKGGAGSGDGGAGVGAEGSPAAAAAAAAARRRSVESGGDGGGGGEGPNPFDSPPKQGDASGGGGPGGGDASGASGGGDAVGPGGGSSSGGRGGPRVRARPALVHSADEPASGLDSKARRAEKGRKKKEAETPPLIIDGVEVHVSQLGVSDEDAEDVDKALRQFGTPRFDETRWVDDFYRGNNEYEAADIAETLERWQGAMKKGLRGAVLEQYEYFVEASKEMTTMGREVQSLRALAEGQRETIGAMKNIDFAAAFADPVADEYGYSSEEESEDEEDEEELKDDGSSVGTSVASSQTDSTGWSGGGKKGGGKKGRRAGKNKKASDDEQSNKDPAKAEGGEDGPEGEGTLIEIPEWLADATEEISAFIKECRYTDATDMILKVKNQVNEILNQHEKLTEMRLSKKQLANMQRILHDTEGLTDRVGNRLAEGLRRKNEALKQAAKRERADPLSVLAPLVSPICLADDATALHLLVKLGRPQDAATAYAARRSLLLMECLHERPISSSAAPNAGTMDVVIYAAQLSQSFFSCLAMAVEGFLDLFLDGGGGGEGGDGGGDNNDGEMSSIHSNAAGGKVPAGAIAAVVLWCDSELSKFAAAFGGTRVLGNLALSPPVRGAAGGDKSASAAGAALERQIAEQQAKLRDAEEGGQYAAAARIRQRLAELEREGREDEQRGGGRAGRRGGGGDERTPKATAVDGKERQAAVDVASKCVDQAFQFASENLDSIGLPLTPRLAEYVRARLKGCEAEIAASLEGRWDHITFDWANDEGGTDVEQEPRRGRMSELRRSDSGDDG